MPSHTSRQTRLRSDKYNANITKRGQVGAIMQEKKENKERQPVSPVLIGFLFFVLVGSSVFQMIRMAQSGPIF
eukprot:gene44318-54194_t